MDILYYFKDNPSISKAIRIEDEADIFDDELYSIIDTLEINLFKSWSKFIDSKLLAQCLYLWSIEEGKRKVMANKS